MVEDYPVAVLGAGDVSVNMLMCPVNPADINQIQGGLVYFSNDLHLMIPAGLAVDKFRFWVLSNVFGSVCNVRCRP